MELKEVKDRGVQNNEKKYQIENMKKRIEFIKKNGQIRYYKLLRDM